MGAGELTWECCVDSSRRRTEHGPHEPAKEHPSTLAFPGDYGVRQFKRRTYFKKGSVTECQWPNME